jgi:nucleoside-specific outer membrane channel protein Tsx
MFRRQLLRTTVIALSLVLSFSFVAGAAQWSSTKAELLYGWDYEERDGEDSLILTVANATGWKYGDSFLTFDVVKINERSDTEGIHLEWGPRLSLLRAFGQKPMTGPIKDVYVIAQADIDANRFTERVTLMGGLSADWNVPGFAFLKTHIQYRDDPNFDGDSVQFNLVWNMPFSIKSLNFSFEGFLDYTTSEGASEKNLLTQPQLLWHATKNIAVGLEYQYWQNRLGIDGKDESVPQAMVRWTF